MLFNPLKFIFFPDGFNFDKFKPFKSFTSIDSKDLSFPGPDSLQKFSDLAPYPIPCIASAIAEFPSI